MTLQKLLDGLQAAVTTHSTLTLVLVYITLNLIEISPIKVQPLSWVFKGLRKALIGSLEERMGRIEATSILPKSHAPASSGFPTSAITASSTAKSTLSKFLTT